MEQEVIDSVYTMTGTVHCWIWKDNILERLPDMGFDSKSEVMLKEPGVGLVSFPVREFSYLGQASLIENLVESVPVGALGNRELLLERLNTERKH